jgi:hypothetical protein
MTGLITKNIRSSIEVAEIPEGCLMGNEGIDTRADTTSVAISRVDDTVGALEQLRANPRHFNGGIQPVNFST